MFGCSVKGDFGYWNQARRWRNIHHNATIATVRSTHRIRCTQWRIDQSNLQQKDKCQPELYTRTEHQSHLPNWHLLFVPDPIHPKCPHNWSQCRFGGNDRVFAWMFLRRQLVWTHLQANTRHLLEGIHLGAVERSPCSHKYPTKQHSVRDWNDQRSRFNRNKRNHELWTYDNFLFQQISCGWQTHSTGAASDDCGFPFERHDENAGRRNISNSREYYLAAAIQSDVWMWTGQWKN